MHGDGVVCVSPVPFVDDILVGKYRRKMVRGILKKNGMSRPNPSTVKRLAQWEKMSFSKQVGRVVTGLVFKPIKKLFRTVFFWFAARDAGRAMVETYLLSRTIQRLDDHQIPLHSLSYADAERVAGAFSSAIKSIDRRALSHLSQKAWRGVRRRKGFRRLATEGVEEQEGLEAQNAVEEAIREDSPGFVDQFNRTFDDALRQLANS